jgi:hypothetical protein
MSKLSRRDFAGLTAASLGAAVTVACDDKDVLLLRHRPGSI